MKLEATLDAVTTGNQNNKVMFDVPITSPDRNHHNTAFTVIC